MQSDRAFTPPSPITPLVSHLAFRHSKAAVPAAALLLLPLQGSDFSGTKLVGVQFARAQAQGAALRGADLTDANCFGSSFDGADLEVWLQISSNLTLDYWYFGQLSTRPE